MSNAVWCVSNRQYFCIFTGNVLHPAAQSSSSSGQTSFGKDIFDTHKESAVTVYTMFTLTCPCPCLPHAVFNIHASVQYSQDIDIAITHTVENNVLSLSQASVSGFYLWSFSADVRTLG
jgi:hypothetical protein